MAYEVQVSTDGGATWSTAAGVAGPRSLAFAAPGGRTYLFRVRSTAAGQSSSWSEPFAVDVDVGPALAPWPEGLAAGHAVAVNPFTKSGYATATDGTNSYVVEFNYGTMEVLRELQVAGVPSLDVLCLNPGTGGWLLGFAIGGHHVVQISLLEWEIAATLDLTAAGVTSLSGGVAGDPVNAAFILSASGTGDPDLVLLRFSPPGLGQDTLQVIDTLTLEDVAGTRAGALAWDTVKQVLYVGTLSDTGQGHVAAVDVVAWAQKSRVVFALPAPGQGFFRMAAALLPTPLPRIYLAGDGDTVSVACVESADDGATLTSQGFVELPDFARARGMWLDAGAATLYVGGRGTGPGALDVRRVVLAPLEAAGGLLFGTCPPEGDVPRKGYAVLSTRGEMEAFALALQDDGKVIVGGRKHVDGRDVFMTARFAGNGVPDPGYGDQGVSAIDQAAGTNGVVRGLVVQPSGLIVGAGTFTESGGAKVFAFLRWGTLGLWDETFGPDPESLAGVAKFAFTGDAECRALARKSDGTLIAAGWQGTAPGRTFALAAVGPDGATAAFGTGGKVTTAWEGDAVAYGVAPQSDGKLVVVGTAYHPQGGVGTSDEESYDVALARYLGDGTPDLSFGGYESDTGFGRWDDLTYYAPGTTRIPYGFGGFQELTVGQAVLILPDGRIMTAGYHDTDRGGPDLTTWLIKTLTTAAGHSVSDYFLSPGIGTDSLYASGEDIAVTRLRVGGFLRQSDGKQIVVGHDLADPPGKKGFLVRYQNELFGRDTTFGTGGVVFIDFGGETRLEAAALRPDGKVVCAGSVTAPGGTPRLAVARFNADGSPDTTFGDPA